MEFSQRGGWWLMLGALALVTCACPAHEPAAAPRKVPEADAFRPTPLPDRIVLTWAGDPATTQAVTWRTDTTVATAYAELAVAEDGPLFAIKGQRVTATTSPFTSDLGAAHYHAVQFRELTPQTTYAYRVGDGQNWSEWTHFRTASDRPAPFTFVYFGDAQNDLKSLWSRVVREAHRDAPKAAFFLHAGDLVNRAARDAEWGEWFHAGGFITSMIPAIPTPGNHEYDGKRLAPHWRNLFTLPENGPPELAESAYYLDYQGTRIISLNSNEHQAEQVPWLKSVLADNPNRWTIVTFHHPLFSSAKGRDNTSLRNLWQPVFDQFRVDLVLTGHDHTYARSGLVGSENVPTGTSERSTAGGTVYVVSVSGPKMYRVEKRPFMRRVAENTQLYQLVQVDGDELYYQARTATGTLYDAFTLKKRAGEVNELVEQVPEMPERRFTDALLPEKK